MRRRVLAIASVAVLAGACGGGSSPTAATPPTPTPIPSAIVVLDSGNFDAQVASKPGVVEFHSPT